MPDPALPLIASPSACTCARVRKAARRVSQIYDQHIEPYGLTVTQFGILAQLRSLDGVSIGQLAERMVMDPTSLTRGLKPLERRGLVAQAPDPNDRRARRLTLTEEGRQALRAARPGWERAQAQVAAALGPVHLADLTDALDTALARLSA
ncbi:MarR family transcriptional regulator [Phreatobacter aquaticus]|uniref:MarR family transcriptional regulator n=1 Tax=Phreatobacter aquaticus TaxID=2570229 RepID=A0A4D7QTR1_9HYPH|nr:MarR family transcriptional regulator [Phreatobacter aquaticus]QCK88447.1 MarR family transcriptional regulator [Phreatobacter aquaticus]